MSYENLKLKELQQLCKEKCIKSSGNKDAVIRRLQEYDTVETNERESQTDVMQKKLQSRIHELEKTVAQLQNQSQISEVTIVPMSRSTPVVTEEQSDSPVSNIRNNVGSVATTTTASNATPLQVHVTNTSTPVVTSNFAHSAPQATTYFRPVREYMPNVNEFRGHYNMHNQMGYNATSNAHMPATTLSNFANQGNEYMPTNEYGYQSDQRCFRNYVTASNAYVPTTNIFSTANPHNGFSNNLNNIMPTPYEYLRPHVSIREMVELMPEFHPLSAKSLSAAQFVNRIQLLKEAYQWDERALLCAVQQKLKGPAKDWIDSQQTICQTWLQFRGKLCLDFPHEENTAMLHIEMANTKRKLSETPQEYYFKMVSMGARGNLKEREIITHIINGINENDLKRKMSQDYNFCTQLLQDINLYTAYNEIKVEKYNIKQQIDTKSYERKSPTRLESKVKCYNCLKVGHISKNCLDPPKKMKCTKCNRTNHTAENCRAVTKVNQIGVDDSDVVLKYIHANEIPTKAFVESGSN